LADLSDLSVIQYIRQLADLVGLAERVVSEATS
jgi:hypothetical protein